MTKLTGKQEENVNCCGCTTQTCAKIVGSISLILAVAVSIPCSIISIDLGRAKRPFEELTIPLSHELLSLVWSFHLLVYVFTILEISLAIFSVMLLISAWKRSNPLLIIPWMVFHVLLLTFITECSLFFAFSDLVDDVTLKATVGIVGSLIVTVLGFPSWLAVFQFYSQLRSRRGCQSSC